MISLLEDIPMAWVQDLSLLIPSLLLPGFHGLMHALELVELIDSASLLSTHLRLVFRVPLVEEFILSSEGKVVFIQLLVQVRMDNLHCCCMHRSV